MIFTGLLFIPIETLFPQHKEQPLLRKEWREDLFYYLVSSMLVQVLSWISLGPSRFLLAHTSWESLRGWIAGLPLAVQIVAIIFLTDLVQYWLHRAFHRVPFLWRFHEVHHSAKSMDWMAGARMHIVEICILRGTTVLPMMVLGFSAIAVQIYIFIVYLWATFIHANIGWRLRGIEQLLVVPRFHHWHHGIEKEAIDVNFAVHFPWLDRLFGTYHLPGDRWPDGYGVAGHPVPKGYWRQFWYPFRSDRPAGPSAESVQDSSLESTE
jgi:sterol desaturase/sphingolipid hydroxylase (fatty acid hydroxylase superfamily)